ncbi:hypothetical protein MTO96_000792 [Rhipicephalus appendiculatus]
MKVVCRSAAAVAAAAWLAITGSALSNNEARHWRNDAHCRHGVIVVVQLLTKRPKVRFKVKWDDWCDDDSHIGLSTSDSGFPMISSSTYEEVALTDILMFKISRKPTCVIRGELRITELEIGPLGHDDKQHLHPVI